MLLTAKNQLTEDFYTFRVTKKASGFFVLLRNAVFLLLATLCPGCRGV